MNKRITSLIMCFIVITISVLSCSIAASAEDDIPVIAFEDDSRDIAQTGASSDYSFTDGDIQVPRINVVTADGNGTSLQKADGYVDAQITIVDTDGSELSDAVTFKVRGNTTAMTAVSKKAFAFKFSKKKNVLGMGKGKKWVLIANAFDPTQLRNYTTFNIAYELGLEYTSNQRFVELWVDGSYRGCYILYEPVQEGSDRVDIDIDSNGGKNDFLIEYEASRVEDDVTYFTVGGLRFIASEPDEPDDDQLAYITDTMNDIIDTLKNGSRDEIEQKLDVASFAKFYLLNDFVKTYDFDMSSVFYYYKNGKLYAGPPWDYDLSAGNENTDMTSSRLHTASKTDGLFANNKNLYKYICDKQWFMDEVRAVYNEHYDFFADLAADGGLLDQTRDEYAELFDRNFTKGAAKVSRWSINIQKKPLPTYEENYDFLKNWYQERQVWYSDYFEVPFYVLGDADNDGEVTIIDATVINRSILDLPVKKINAVAADVDSDGEITIVDATFVQRYDAKIYTPYKVGDNIRVMTSE